MTDLRNRLHRQARQLVEENYELGVMPRHNMTPAEAREVMKKTTRAVVQTCGCGQRPFSADSER